MIKDILSVVFLTALMLAGVELGAQLLYSQMDADRGLSIDDLTNEFHKQADLAISDGYLGYKLRPGAVVNEYRINSQGFRSEEFKTRKDDDVFRVICLGGSTTFGSNAGDNSYTYPALLQRILSKLHPDKRIEVINAGVYGYNTWHLVKLLRDLNSFNPDMFLVMTGLNDVIRAQNLTSQRLQSITADDMTAYRSASPLMKFLVNTSSYKLARELVGEKRGSVDVKDESTERKLELYGTKDNIVYLNQIAAAPVVFLRYPWIVPQAGDFQRLGASDLGLNAAFFQKYQDGRRALNKVWDDLEQTSQLEIFDLQPHFDPLKESRYELLDNYSDSIHFTRKGNLLIARHLAGLIAPRIAAEKRQDGLDAFSVQLPEIDQWKRNLSDRFPSMASDELVVKDIKFSNLEYLEKNSTGYNFDFGFWRPIDHKIAGQMDITAVNQSYLKDSEVFLWFPRIADESSVSLFIKPESGGDWSLLAKTHREKGWTPLIAGYLVDYHELLRKPGTFKLRLIFEGENSSLWTNDAQGLPLYRHKFESR